MYSIPENLDATEFSGWINQDLLLKESRRSTASRKRSYDLTNAVEVEEHCNDHHRRVLRPRHTTEPPSTSGASRTRPIRSNRTRCQRTEATAPSAAPTHVADPSALEMSLFRALSSYGWQQNYLVAHTDPVLVHRQNYSALNVHQLSPRVPHFDPWVLHNYILASSGYSTVVAAASHEDTANIGAQLAYNTMASDSSMNHNLFWQYPFLLNQSFSPIQTQLLRPPELVPNTSTHMVEPQPDLSYFYRPMTTSQRDVISSSNDQNLRTDPIHSVVYQTEPPISNFNSSHTLPSPFSYGSLCPYHNTNHVIHGSQLSSHPLVNTSSNLPEQSSSASVSLNNFPAPSEMTVGHYWQQLAPVIRPVNYPMNSSNIDTLLHLAAHFEQRKRGITREELDKLPTHRHKASSNKAKRAKMSADKANLDRKEDSQKCLVCLEDFESKQSIRTLRCTHEFHAKCIDKWLKINRTCPLCRADSFDGSAQNDGP